MASTKTAPGIGEHVRRRRGDVGLSQAALAELAQVHRGTVRNVELGRPLELRTLGNIWRVLGCRTTGNYRPVFTAKATAIVVRAIPSGSHPTTDLAADWIELVGEAAEQHGGPPSPPPTSYGRLVDALPLSVGQRRLLDDEVSQIFDTDAATPTLIASASSPQHSSAAPSTVAALLAIAEAVDRLTAAITRATQEVPR